MASILRRLYEAIRPARQRDHGQPTSCYTINSSWHQPEDDTVCCYPDHSLETCFHNEQGEKQCHTTTNRELRLLGLIYYHGQLWNLGYQPAEGWPLGAQRP